MEGAKRTVRARRGGGHRGSRGVDQQEDAKSYLSGPVANLGELLVARTMRLLAY